MFKATIGYVLVHVPSQMVDGFLEADPSDDNSVFERAIRRGVVYHANQNTDIPEDNWDFDSPCQVEKGDVVWIHPNATSQILTNQNDGFRVIPHESGFLLAIPYKKLLAKEKNGVLVGLNDHVITVPAEEEGWNGKIHVVCFTQEKGVTYRKTSKDDPEQSVECSVGDKVVLRTRSNLRLESPFFVTLEKPYRAVQSKNILGTI